MLTTKSAYLIIFRDIVDYDSDDDIQDVKYESYLYKITQSKKIKKLWFKLIGKDLYCMIINLTFRL